MRVKYTAKWGLQIAEMIFQTRSGLIRPEYTDPDSGYRYYGVQQFERLNTIRYLRALDMPLEGFDLYQHI